MEKKEQIKNIVDFCSKHIKIGQDQKTQLLKKLFAMQDKELVVFLLYQTQKIFGKNKKVMEQIYDMIFALINYKIESKKQMLDIYQKCCLNHTDKNLMPIEENHKLIKKSIKQICDLFNKNNIDYYVVGALALYLKSGKLKRYHDDIDFMVCESDLPKIKNIIEQTDFCFFDNRFDNNKTLSPDGGHTQGEHEVIAMHKTSEFHLGFFLFERENDCVINVSYFSEIKDNTKQIFVLKNKHTKPKSLFVYGEYFVQVFDTKFRITLPEEVYLIKSSTYDFFDRFKDKIDVDFFEENNLIDKEKFEKLVCMCQYEKTQNVIEKINK